MTPAEVLSRLRAEGFTATRAPDCVVWLEPAGAPSWLAVWLKEVPTPPWTNRLLLLRALDLEERPDSGLTVGTLPLFGAEHWTAKASVRGAGRPSPALIVFTAESYRRLHPRDPRSSPASDAEPPTQAERMK